MAFDNYIPMNWKDIVPGLSDEGIDLLDKML